MKKLGLFALVAIGLALVACAQAPCGTVAPAAAPAPAAETAATDDPEFDEAPGLDEEGSREW